MARFDVFEIAGSELLLDVQSDILMGIATRLVVPLLPLGSSPRAMPRLNPQFEIKTQVYLMVTPLLSAVPVSLLSPRIANLREHQDVITAALDMVFHGF
jgi:toxin CcdB